MIDINVAGNFALNGGTFTANANNTVIFDGDLTFYDGIGWGTLHNIDIGTSPGYNNAHIRFDG